MPGAGPPPKPVAQRRRTNASGPVTKLPSEGRHGETPGWPMGREVPLGCEQIWEQLWTTPQSVAWEHDGIGTVRVVARYATVLELAEDPFTDATAKARAQAEARQLEDRLGLSPMAMRRLGWEVVADEVGEARVAKSTHAPRRLRVVDDAAAGA